MCVICDIFKMTVMWIMLESLPSFTSQCSADFMIQTQPQMNDNSMRYYTVSLFNQSYAKTEAVCEQLPHTLLVHAQLSVQGQDFSWMQVWSLKCHCYTSICCCASDHFVALPNLATIHQLDGLVFDSRILVFRSSWSTQWLHGVPSPVAAKPPSLGDP